MIVFFPFERPVNPFLNEIERYFSGTFIFDHYSKLFQYKNVDVIHIHWPEVLFDSKTPNIEQYNDFLKHFSTWKKDYKIILTLHNLKPHLSKSELYSKLYNEICNNVDVVIHFANNSVKIFNRLYPNSNAKHAVIHHPLYIDIPNEVSKQEARAFLNIEEKYKVVLVFGHIRTKKVREFVLKTFEALKVKYKFLIVSTIGKFKTNFNFGWKINTFVNRYLFYKYNSKSNYILQNNTIQKNEIQNYFNAADVVLIPRLEALNSGVLYLALRFNNKIVAPNIGNIGEVATDLKKTVFDVSNYKTAVKSIEKALIEDNETNNLEVIYNEMHPKSVANKHLKIYNNILNE
jgi:hypothetical protein